ncbi:MAG: flavin reductase family protein [Egibacteraceae bacterium]
MRKCSKGRTAQSQSRDLRRCLGLFATGVTIVTYDGEAAPRGVTVNAFTSVSLEPPLVLVALDRGSRSCTLLADRPFAVNVLSACQHDLALCFSGRLNREIPIPWGPGDIAPVLAGSLATIECLPWRQYDGGDHVLFLGRVERFRAGHGEPLVFFAGQWASVAPTEEEVRHWPVAR